MLDDDAPGLGVDFVIDASDSFGELARLSAVMQSTEAKVLADANRIEKATAGMVDLAGASASVKAFAGSASRDLAQAEAALDQVGAAKAALDQVLGKSVSMTAIGPAATREAAATSREINATEKAIEKEVRALEREAAAFGLSREEKRDARLTELALTAARQGNTDAADRLYAATRRLKQLQESAAEDKMEAETRAAAAAARDRALAEAAVITQLRERSQLEAALARTNGMDRPRATDAGATFSALAAQAAEQEARATALAAAATKQAADEHARLAAMVRASHAAQEADAASLERIRAATDPLYAATSRLNAELAESTRLYHAGVTGSDEYARQQAVLLGRLHEVQVAHGAMGAAAKRGGSSLTQLSFQLNDVATMAAMGAAPLQIFASQAGQIFQVAQMAEGGVKGFAREVGGVALAFLPAAAAIAVAGVAIYRWKEQINDDAGMKKFADGLGLSHKEMKKLGDVSVTTGDLVAGVWKTISDGMGLQGSGKSIMDYLFSPDDAKQVQGFIASIYGFFAGGYDAIVALWGQMSAVVSGYVSAAAAAAGRFFAPVIAAAQWAGNAIGQIFSSIYNWVAGWLKSISGAISPILSAIGQGPAATAISKAGSSLGKTFGDAYSKRVSGFINGSNAIVATIGANAVDKAQERLTKKANQIKADRTPKQPKVDRHAESLARDAEAVEAQIKNLYALADAYGVSGAAALIAEARVKAESKAIRQQADVEAAVSRQVQLAIAQRVSDAAKATATTRDQTAAQSQVNAMVAAGLVPAERAADLVKDQLADLPLLAAIQAAQQRGLAVEAARATAALQAQRDARVASNAAEEQARFNADMASGANRLAEAREELRLVGATDDARARALATLRATQEAQAKYTDPALRQKYVDQQVQIADETERTAAATRDLNDALSFTADRWDLVAQNVQSAAQGMADAFGNAGRAIGDMASIFANYRAQEERAKVTHDANLKAATTAAARDRENAKFALATSTAQVGAYGDMAAAAKGFFHEGSTGYQALQKAEQTFRAIQFALSVRAMAQDAIETGSALAKSAARTAAGAAEAVVNAIKSLPFPLNLAAGAATVAALASIGISIAGAFGGGGKSTLAKANDGTGTVLGDTAAKSESLKRSIDALKEVDTVTSTYAREMAASLRSIDNQIGGVAAQVVKAGDINASTGVKEGFKTDTTGKVLSSIVDPLGLMSKIPVIGGIFGAVKGLISSLFGSKTTVVGSGLYGKAQTVGSIVNGGFDASYYSDIEKQKKFLGIKTGKSYSTQYSAADAGLENQFTLILRSFNDAIAAAAGPLGQATADVQARLNGFVVNIGKIDLKGLTGEQIQEKLTAVFGAAADSMADAAFPGIARFQKVGEGAFETLVRVASTVEAVSTSLDQLGFSARALGIDAKLGLADQFDSVSDMTSAASAYFQAFYSKEEQAAAQAAQFGKVFASLGVAMPASLAGFRQLVEAQDLNTAAGQATYATLLKLAPAFADLQAAMEGAKSAADIASERQDLERQLLELRGDTAALRALDLAKLDASNRALQQQVWAMQDAQEAAKAADELRQAWTSVGDSIMDEVKRIRGLTDVGGGNSFAALMGQFNAATAAARAGDQDAAKGLPALSQALLTAAADQATSRQELARVQAQTAASLEATYGVVAALAGSGKATASTDSVLAAASATQGGSAPAAANDDMATEIRALREEVAALRADNNAGHAATASNTGRIDRKLEAVTTASGGEAISVAGVAA